MTGTNNTGAFVGRHAGWSKPLLAAAAVAVASFLGASGLFTHEFADAAQASNTDVKSFLLVARRDLGDPIFQQTVILMLPPDQPPLVGGVIINKPTNVSLDQLFKHSVTLSNGSDKVYFGGPVELNSPLMVVHNVKPAGQSTQLGSDAFAIDDPGVIAQSLKGAHSDMRLYLGRAQWTQEQLRGEILDGAWDVMPLRTDLIFYRDPSKVWPELIGHEHVREVDIDCYQSGEPAGFSRCEQDLGFVGAGI